MIDILIRGDYVFTGEELVRDGYVYIERGKVREIGSGVPPEDLTMANMILGGPGRIVVPSLLAPLDLLGYAARTPRCEPLLPQTCEDRGGIPAEEEFTASLPAVLEAHVHGIGRILALTPSLHTLLLLAERVGGAYGQVVPEGCSGGSEHPRLEAVVPVSRIPARPLPCPLEWLRQDDPFLASEELARALGLEPPRVKEGGRAELAVFSLHRPPLFGLSIDSPRDARLIYRFAPPAETLIAGEDVLVEVGEHLMIVEKHLRDASRIITRIVAGR